MSRPHIFVDASPLAKAYLSGVSHYTLGIVQGFDDLAANDKLSYSLIVPKAGVKTIKQLGLKHYKKIITNPLSSKLLRQLIQRNMCPPLDWLFGAGHYYFPDFLAWPLSKRSYSVVVIHDMAFKALPETILPKNREYLEQIVPLSIKRANRVITVSNFSKTEIQKYYGNLGQKISVVYPAVNRQIFYPKSQTEIRTVKEKLSIKSDYILAVGNLEPRKNHLALIKAYQALPADIKKRCGLVIVGAEGWNNRQILDAIKSVQANGGQIIVPKQFVTDEELACLYSGAVASACLSKYEGFGMQILESLACGTPVIINDAASLPEAGGNPALKVLADKEEQVTEAIKQAIGLKNQTNWANQARAHVGTFNWRSSAKETVDILLNI